MKRGLLSYEPDRLHRQVQTNVDSLEPDQRNLSLESTTQSSVLGMLRVVAAPLVTEISVRPWFVVVRTLIWPRRVHRPEAERRIEHPRFSNATLSVEKWHGLTVDLESR